MKIAYCISAYKDAVHLGRLIEALDADDTCFIVHVDKRVKDIGPFRRVVESHHNAWLTAERYLVQWGSWAQVRYQRLFLKEAVAAGADRIFVLSGQDYPLWSNDCIHRFCRDNAERAFVTGLNITTLSQPYPPMRLYLELYHPLRDIPICYRTAYRALTATARTILKWMGIRRRPYILIDSNKWDVWQTSGYFSVNRRQAEYVLRWLNDKRITSYFRHCFVPEELTIPTIIFNSPWSDKAHVYEHQAYHGIASLAALHYFHYSGSIKVFTECDYDTLVASDRMFCRKVVTGASDELVCRIDEKRKKEEGRDSHR